MNISAAYYSEIGGREKNEDVVSLHETKESVIAMVADGLGGHTDGEIASKTAVNAMNLGIAHEKISSKVLQKAVESANDSVIREQNASKMKTTIAAVWFDEHNALAANVGDTRIYQFRDNEVIYQSKDHSVAQMSYLAGDMTLDEVRTSKERHKLTRALGAQEEIKIDIESLLITKKDAILLCSDGFWERILEEDMLSDLSESDNAGEWLGKMRKRFGKDEKKGDNHSAIAIMIG